MNATTAIIGAPLDRIDGVAKVTGTATYAAEVARERLCVAVMVTSAVACGRVRIDDAQARGVPGVLAVLTPSNAMRLPNGGNPGVAPPAGRTLSLLQDDEVHYNGQPIAVVVAETLAAAQWGAARLVIDYQELPAQLSFSEARRSAYPPRALTREKTDSVRGEPAQAMAAAATRITATYTTPLEFHNPMEPHATIAVWQGERLTLYDSTQSISGLQKSVAKVFGIDAAQVHTVCPYTGGGFGSKGSMWSHVVLAAMAAKTVGRPVKLEVARPQMFFAVGSRPRTEQTIVLACDADDRLVAVKHDTVSSTSVMEDWAEGCGVVTRMLYACDNLATTHRLAAMNVGVPTFMRAPGEASGSFALECAMDELAYARQIDPIALRLANYAERDGHTNKPFSSKNLRECYRLAAERFGWSRRTAQPRSMRAGHRLIGMGMATATYPANRSKAEALARLNADGSVLVRSGTQDLGTGTYTIMAQIAADALGFPMRQVRFELGDSDYPVAPGSGGSQSAASVGPAVLAACSALKDKMIASALADPGSPLYGAHPDDVMVADGWILHRNQAGRRDAPAELIGRRHGQPLEATAAAELAQATKDAVSSHSFGAVCAEVQVDEDLGQIRVERITAVYDVGRILNAKTAHSQLMGGIVWGISMALMEDGRLDERYGRIVNNNFAEYHVPVNADVRDIDIVVLPGADTAFNPLGARGIGEIGITGVAAALANAVFHATGQRLRDLPLTLDKLI